MFLYNQMPAYDNTRPMNINSLLRAKAEATRITSQYEVTDPDKTDNCKLSGGIDEAYNQILLDRKTEAKAFDKALNEGIELAMAEPSGVPACIKLTGVQSKKTSGDGKADCSDYTQASISRIHGSWLKRHAWCSCN